MGRLFPGADAHSRGALCAEVSGAGSDRGYGAIFDGSGLLHHHSALYRDGLPILLEKRGLRYWGQDAATLLGERLCRAGIDADAVVRFPVPHSHSGGRGRRPSAFWPMLPR